MSFFCPFEYFYQAISCNFNFTEKELDKKTLNESNFNTSTGSVLFYFHYSLSDTSNHKLTCNPIDSREHRSAAISDTGTILHLYRNISIM